MAKKQKRQGKKQKKSYMWLIVLFFVFALFGGGNKETKEIETQSSQVETLTTVKATEEVIQRENAEEIIEEPKQIEVHYIDVGQSDATLIISNGHTMLIDAGDDTQGTKLQSYLNSQGVEKLDYLVLTNPDADHIGGAPVIIEKFKIDTVLVSNFEKDNKTYQKLIQALDNKLLKAVTPNVGAKFPLGSATITILAPNKTYSDPNNSSIALLVKNGDNTFLFSGDAEEEAEVDILATGLSVNADVFQAGHHGSKTSNSQEFLTAINPEYVVISCGEGNSYGHPHAQTLNTLRSMGVKVYRTDEQGTIVAKADGISITWNMSPSESWLAGESTQSATTTVEETTTEETTVEETTIVETTTAKAITTTYVLNTSTHKFHKTSCSYLPTKNRQDTTKSRGELIAAGYSPCKKCNP